MSIRRTIQFATAAVVVSVALSFGAPAGAIDNPDYTSPAPAQVVNNATPQAQSRTAAAADPAAADPASADPASKAAVPSSQSLPVTGSDVAQLALIGMILVAVGIAAMGLRRRAAV